MRAEREEPARTASWPAHIKSVCNLIWDRAGISPPVKYGGLWLSRARSERGHPPGLARRDASI